MTNLCGQDYELWTRIVGQARFRKVDATVYRYRKHAVGSWGEFIDLSLDSKIIRRHLARHPMPVLFPQFDWSYPEWATVLAYMRIAKNLRCTVITTTRCDFSMRFPRSNVIRSIRCR